MARSEQSATSQRKSDYRRSPSADDDTIQSKTSPPPPPPASSSRTKMFHPIKRVQHPADRSSLLTFLERLAKICLTLIISIPSVLILTILLPISSLIRMFIRLTCRYRCPITPCTCSYLTGSDLFWLYNSNLSLFENKHDERRNLQSPPVTPIAAAVFYLEGTVNENSLKKVLINRLISSNSRRGSTLGQKLFPRFSQIIISHFSGLMWIDHANFSIDDHVREIPRHIQSEEDLQGYVSTLISSALPATRPLWQLHFKNRSASRPNDSILIFLYHPVLSDGISLLRILLRHIVDNRTTQLDIKPRFAGRHGEQIFNYIRAYLFGHVLVLKNLIFNPSIRNLLQQLISKRTLTTNARRSINSVERLVVWSSAFSLNQANRMKLVTRTRMNDLLSTIILSSVKLYMEKSGISMGSRINCVIPCDLRSNTPNIVMGNQVAHLCLELPMNIEGNIPLLWSLNEKTKRMKQNGDYATMYLFTQMIYLLFPLCLANKIMARIYNHATIWLTSLAAGTSTSLATMSICNRDVRSLICLNPSLGRSAINFCATSYADEIRLAVTVDPNVIPDPQFFTECFNHQLSVVQDLLAHRRIPGEIRRITRPPRFQAPKKSITSISDASDDLSIEEIQAKMTTLQQELLSLKSQFENVDMNDPSSETQRLIITSKLEELRREFRELLIKLQERQCELSGMIPSDEEDEMDPHVRVRLRSASVASKISLRSNEQRQMSSRIYQADRDETSEYSSSLAQGAAFMSNSSVAKGHVNASPIDAKQAGMRRAQSVSIVENTRVDVQRRTSLTRSRPTTPARTFTVTPSTIIYMNTNENGKTSS